MGVDAKTGKGVQRHSMFVHVTLHYQRVEPYKADAVQRLVFGVAAV
jgi:hypothetical protein